MIKQSELLLLVGFSGVNNAENQFSMPGMEQSAVALCMLQSLGEKKLNKCVSVCPCFTCYEYFSPRPSLVH